MKENSLNYQSQNKPVIPDWLYKVGLVILFFAVYFTVGGAITYYSQSLIPKWLNLSSFEYQNLVSNNSTYMLLNYLIGFSYTITIIYFYWKYVIEKPFPAIGFIDKNWIKNFALGMFIGIITISLGFILELALGFVKIENINISFPDLSNYLIMFILVAVSEEVMTRGLILQTLMEGMNKYLALCIVSLIFGALHLLNAHVTWLSFVNISIAGIFLGISYLHNKSLWFPIGLHFTWNLFQGPVYGFEVSGFKNHSIVSQTVHGNQLMTGGDFGFEGSLLAMPIMVFTAFFIHKFYQKQQLNQNLSTNT